MFQAWRIGLGCAVAVLSLAIATRAAHAVPEFPRAIERNLDLDYEPPCYLCHVKDKTGLGTAESPFALSMRDHGLDANNQNSLGTALTQLADDKIDSDGDGVDDVDELKAGTDPNTDAPVALKDAIEPNWGCSALPTNRAGTNVAALLAIGLPLCLVCRRRRRRR